MPWNHWTTPQHIIERIGKLGRIGVDPCWNANATTNPRVKFDGDKFGDGLAVNWFDVAIPGDVILVNPPYDDLETWRAACASMARPSWRPYHLVLISPNNADTLSWRHVETADAIAVYRGRVDYGNPPPGARADRPRFATSIAYWGTDAPTFRDIFVDVASVSRFWGRAA